MKNVRTDKNVYSTGGTSNIFKQIFVRTKNKGVYRYKKGEYYAGLVGTCSA